MKTLPLKLRKNGYEYVQVLRGERSCIYEQKVADDLNYYEVFLIRIKPERVIQGKRLEAKEWFPHDEAWGDWAWTFPTYEEALWRFNELEAGKTKKEFIDFKTGKLKYNNRGNQS